MFCSFIFMEIEDELTKALIFNKLHSSEDQPSINLPIRRMHNEAASRELCCWDGVSYEIHLKE